MKRIKVKENRVKDIKKIDKAKAWTERIKDPIIYGNKKLNDVIDNDSSVNEYITDRANYIANRTKDETIYANKKALNKTKNAGRKIKGKIKEKREEKIRKKVEEELKNESGKIVQGSSNEIKKAVEKTNEKLKLSKRIKEQGKRLAISGTKKVANGTKRVAKSGVSAIKGILKSLKSLIAALTASGIFVFIILLLLTLVFILLSSVFGIFFSSANVENSIKMSDCIAELNDEMDNRINVIEKAEKYDNVVIDSNRTSWKEILSIYAVRVAKGDDGTDVITMDKEKKNILKEVFWDMNSINHNTIVEEYESDSIGTLDSYDLTDVGHNTIPSYTTNPETNKKRILHINIKSKAVNEIMNKYEFTDEMREQYLELTSEENDKLWYGVIYGNYYDNGEISEWKQGNREWADIKIGTTNKTIGGIGCLTTSIAILIKKSGVPTKDIYPFNPGTFVIALNNNYGFDKHGNLSYKAISKAVPDFKYEGTVELRGMSKSQKLYHIQKYAEKGYYLAIEVKGATKNSQHWVALDSVNNNTILMHDPSVGNETNMWNKYDWTKTSQFIYFKANK